MSHLVIDNCDIFHLTIFLHSNNFQLKEMSQIIEAADFQPVFIYECTTLKTISFFITPPFRTQYGRL